jgi:hypothetical protein
LIDGWRKDVLFAKPPLGDTLCTKKWQTVPNLVAPKMQDWPGS